MGIRAATLTLLVFLGCACHRKATSAEPADAASAKASTPAEAAAVKHSADEPVEVAPSAAAECVDDRGCDGYLRCIEGACAVPPAVTGIAPEQMGTATFEGAGEPLATYYIELAVQPWERTRGLMYRRKMHPDFGMLFVFEADEVRSFWMKNTYLPLDMVHINSEGVVVGVVANAEPMTTSSRRTGKPARYVLELVAGAAAAKGIEEGVTMKLANVPEELRPQ